MTDSETTDDEREPTDDEILDAFTEDYHGDQYIEPSKAAVVVDVFKDDLEDALDAEHDAMQEAQGLWVNRYVANVAKMAKDANGVPTVPQFETLVLVEELSTQLAEDLDVTVGSGMSVGHGANAREKHDTTMMNLLDFYEDDDG